MLVYVRTAPGVLASEDQQPLKVPEVRLSLYAAGISDARVVVARECRHRLDLERIGSAAVKPRVSDFRRNNW